jgi:hypothetical protein
MQRSGPPGSPRAPAQRRVRSCSPPRLGPCEVREWICSSEPCLSWRLGVWWLSCRSCACVLSFCKNQAQVARACQLTSGTPACARDKRPTRFLGHQRRVTQAGSMLIFDFPPMLRGTHRAIIICGDDGPSAREPGHLIACPCSKAASDEPIACRRQAYSRYPAPVRYGLRISERRRRSGSAPIGTRVRPLAETLSARHLRSVDLPSAAASPDDTPIPRPPQS